MSNNNKMCWRDFFTGFVSGAAIVLLFAVFMMPGMISSNIKEVVGGGSSTSNTTSTEGNASTEDESTLKSYVTDIVDWDVETEDGTTLSYKTPNGWYSLADQYNDGLIQYYGTDLPDTGIVCVGDNTDQYNASVIINARPLSCVSEVLEVIYGDEYDQATMLYSDTYLYMKNGTEPDGTTIEELDSITSGDGHTYRVFLHGFDTEYYTNEEQTETETVHTDELVAYSDTEDTVEVIMYMQEFDKDVAMGYLKEFLEATE